MLRILFLLPFCVALLAGVAACKPKPTAAQLQSGKVKAFQDRQKIEAIKTYTALVTKYPDSEFASKAQERLNVLGPLPAATPVPKKK